MSIEHRKGALRAAVSIRKMASDYVESNREPYETESQWNYVKGPILSDARQMRAFASLVGNGYRDGFKKASAKFHSMPGFLRTEFHPHLTKHLHPDVINKRFSHYPQSNLDDDYDDEEEFGDKPYVRIPKTNKLKENVEMTTKYTVADVVQAAIEKNPLEMQKAVSQLMLDRVAAIVDAKREQLVNSYYNAGSEDDENKEEEELEELEDDENEEEEDDFDESELDFENEEEWGEEESEEETDENA